MKNLKQLGNQVQDLRATAGLSQNGLAEAIKVDNTLMSKIENGHVQPTPAQLQAMIQALQLNHSAALTLWSLSGRPPESILVVQSTEQIRSDLERSKPMADKPAKAKQPTLNMVIDRNRVQTVYSDIAVIGSNENGMILQFGLVQPTAVEGQGQADVVASVGVSFDHARKIANTINQELDKNER